MRQLRCSLCGNLLGETGDCTRCVGPPARPPTRPEQKRLRWWPLAAMALGIAAVLVATFSDDNTLQEEAKVEQLKIKKGQSVFVRFSWEPITAVVGGTVSVDGKLRALEDTEVEAQEADVTEDINGSDGSGAVRLELWRASQGESWSGAMKLETASDSASDADQGENALIMRVGFEVEDA